MAGEIGLALMGTGLSLGLRHGVDWDHIAAITDVTGSQPTRLRSLVMGTLYASGHAVVILALGFTAIWFGSLLPETVDPVMETIVGVTLVALGIWLFWSLIRNRGDVALRSRWMLMYDLVRAARRRLPGRRGPEAVRARGSRAYGPATSASIGMIHGVGAETGTQALLLASAAGATSAASGSFLLIFFTVGLILSNTVITVGSTVGIIGARARRAVHIWLGVLIASFSLIVGTLFLLRQGSTLPGFFA